MLLGLETYSYIHWFAAGRMDVFGFIRRCKELGLDGVQLNIGVPQDNWGMLGGADPSRLQAVRELCDELGLFVQVDTRTYDIDTLTQALRISAMLGADTLRTYISTPEDLSGSALQAYMAPGGGLDIDLAKSVQAIQSLVPLCQETGVRLAIENHEYETSTQIMNLVQAIDSPWVGAHVDTGNLINVWEDPAKAVATMAPKTFSTHLRDHLVIEDQGERWVVGVPFGKGHNDLTTCYNILASQAPLNHRLCLEVCYGYRSRFRKPPTPHQAQQLGHGAYQLARPPYDPACISPYPNALNPSTLPAHEYEQFLAWCDLAVVQSVGYMQEINHSFNISKPTQSGIMPS